MAEAFLYAFNGTATVICCGAGIVAAIVLAAAVCLICAMLAGGLFDLVTTWLGRRWKKRKRPPRGRIARIILEHSDGV